MQHTICCISYTAFHNVRVANLRICTDSPANYISSLFTPPTFRYHTIYFSVYVTDDLSIERIEGFYRAWVVLRLDDWRLCRVLKSLLLTLFLHSRFSFLHTRLIRLYFYKNERSHFHSCWPSWCSNG